MSFDTFEKIKFENDIYFKLKETELEAKLTVKRYNHNEIVLIWEKLLKRRWNSEYTG